MDWVISYLPRLIHSLIYIIRVFVPEFAVDDHNEHGFYMMMYIGCAYHFVLITDISQIIYL